MKNTIFKLLLSSTLCFSLSSCITHYIPPPVNNPMLSRESEIQVNVSGTAGITTGMLNVNLAYSPIHNIGVGYMYNSYKADLESNLNGTVRKDQLYKGRYNEFLAGYYKGFGKHGLLELYTGMGFGNSNYNYVDYFTSGGSDGKSELSHTRLFLMPAIGFKYKNFQMSYGFKLSRLNYHKVTYTDMTYTQLIEEVSRIGRAPYLFCDNAVTFKFGGEGLKAIIQIAATDQLSGNYISYDPSRFTFGLQYQFYAKP